MNRSTLLAAFAALVFASAAAALLASRPADYTLKVAQLETELKLAREEISRLKNELAQAVERSRSAALATAPGSKSSPGGNGSSDVTSKGGGSSAPMAKMFEDPKMREMMKAQQSVQIEMQYAKLFGKLQLDETEMAHFKKLLSDRLSAKTDLGFKMMNAGLSPDERKALTADYDAKKKSSDDAIKQFLNDDGDYSAFQQWEDTEAERMQLMMGRGSFDAAGVPLTGDQEDQLVNLMAQVRKENSQMPDWNNPKTFDPAKMTDEYLTSIAKMQDAAALKVLNGSASFLSPQQQAALKKMQDQMRAMMEAGLKMTKAMMETPNK